MIFDTHAHYNDKQFDADRIELLTSMKEQNVGTILNVGASLQDCKDALELANTYNFIYAAVGVHPDSVGELTEESFRWLSDLAKEKKVIAIGEIGLDYHWNVETLEIQKKWFIRQLELARELDLPLSIHSREAAKDTFQIMKEYGKGLRGSIHCYSYSLEMAKEYIKLGFHIGVGGVITFKNSRKLKETVEGIPMEWILLETDAPYLAPVPYRGKRNNSAYIDLVAQQIGNLKGFSKEEVIAITEANAEQLFFSKGR